MQQQRSTQSSRERGKASAPSILVRMRVQALEQPSQVMPTLNSVTFGILRVLLLLLMTCALEFKLKTECRDEERGRRRLQEKREDASIVLREGCLKVFS